MTASKVTAPWTPEQIEALNRYQEAGRFHPFTCRNRNDGGHPWRMHDFGILVATPGGWVCTDCDYAQDWAYDFMAAGGKDD